MAEKTKTKTEHEHKTKTKKHLRAITTHKSDDGGFVHTHHYEDEAGNPLPDSFGGVSTNMQDLHQHMEDQLNPQGQEMGAGGDGGGAGSAAPQAPPEETQQPQ